MMMGEGEFDVHIGWQYIHIAGIWQGFTAFSFDRSVEITHFPPCAQEWRRLLEFPARAEIGSLHFQRA